MDSNIGGGGPSNGCLISIGILVVIGIIAAIIWIIKGIIWLFNHIQIS